eukprot:CCRYP_005611-RA/>CCRYP_005611-RA protein AED:0.75 eAED:0.40 QI:0/0/0/0.5/0/0/2/0/286
MPGSNRHRQRRLNQVSLLTQLLQQQHDASDTEHTEAASAVQTDSDSSTKHKNRHCDRGRDNERNNRRGGRRWTAGTAQQLSASAQPLPTLQEICTPQAAPQNSRRPLFLEQAIQRDTVGSGFAARWKSRMCPGTNLLPTWVGTLKGKLENFNIIPNNKSSFYTSVSNYYSTLPHYAADPPHTSTIPSKQQFSLAPKLPQPTPIPSSFKHKAQRKALERQARRLRLLNEATLLDRHISWAEDERTTKAKADTTSKQRRAIDTAHTMHPRKQHQLSHGQAMATTIRRA